MEKAAKKLAKESKEAQDREKHLPGIKVDVRKGIEHVSSLGVLHLCDLVHYYFQLKVINLGKMKKDELLDIINLN